MSEIPGLIDQVKFDDKGLVTAIAVDAKVGDVIMLAFMNRQSLAKTLETRIMTYWSRSRQKLWVKGETSGNTQSVQSVRIDCDGDALLFRVIQQGRGAACHMGYRSCFFRELKEGGWEEIDKPVFDPKEVY
jgi:phosphoribosyl-AMP cyclohydrolase